MALNLSIFDIVKGPVVSKKATLLNQKLKKLVLIVHPQANKVQIKNAIQQLFDVKVEKVNSLNRVGKSYRVRRRTIVQGSTTKRVIVTLKEGYAVDLFGQSAKTVVSSKEE